MSAGYACAECGTTTAQTYVVTTLDPDDPAGTTTEVCRACDDELRFSALVAGTVGGATALRGIDREENDPEQEHDEEIAEYLLDEARNLCAALGWDDRKRVPR